MRSEKTPMEQYAILGAALSVLSLSAFFLVINNTGILEG